MAEPSHEFSNEIEKDTTLHHGALEINFPARYDSSIDKRHPYHCKNTINGKKGDLSPERMSLIMSIPEKTFRTFDEIKKDYKTWLQGSYNDAGLNTKMHELSHSSFGVLMHKIQIEFGYDIFDYASTGRYKMKEYKKK